MDIINNDHDDTTNHDIKSSKKSYSNCCSYCSIIMCNNCSNKLCHVAGYNRSTCSEHTKFSKLIEIDGNRILATTHKISNNDVIFMNYYKIIADKIPKLFQSYYNDLAFSCRYLEIFDAKDNTTWTNILPFSGIYLFPTSEIAQVALQFFPCLKSLSDINDPDYVALSKNNTVQFQICYQCNKYQAKFPYSRIYKNAPDPNIKSKSLIYCPNFYAEGLCRKVNSSHELKMRGGRKKSTLYELKCCEQKLLVDDYSSSSGASSTKNDINFDSKLKKQKRNNVSKIPPHDNTPTFTHTNRTPIITPTPLYVHNNNVLYSRIHNYGSTFNNRESAGPIVPKPITISKFQYFDNNYSSFKTHIASANESKI